MSILKKANEFFTFIADDSEFADMEKLKVVYFLWLLSLGFFCATPFAFYSLWTGDSTMFLLALFFITNIIISILALYKGYNISIVMVAMNFAFFLFLSYFIVASYDMSYRILWCYIFPLASIFLFGKRVGIIWSIALLLVFCIVIFFLEDGKGYSNLFAVRFVLTYTTVTFIASWLQHYKHRFQVELIEKNQELEKEISERKILEEKLTVMAHTDSLTGLLNRRFFWKEANKEIDRAIRHEIPTILAVLDIDFFKKINDSYGHPVGDEVLRILARRCKYILRSSDLLARIGGEEFAFLLVHIDIDEAHRKFQKLQKEIEKLSITLVDKPIQITVSVGLASLSVKGDNIDTLDTLYSKADKVLYNAKQSGRNKICYR